ncbi:MAG: response regulator transcription factor [Phycisphaerales bacterium]|nr:response regulator transcription factor [Phycisphaerales bacterium]
MTMATRVLCVDDHAFLVEGLKARLALEADLSFVGRLPSAEGLVRTVRDTRADIVLLDIEMPGPDVFEALQDLTAQCPDVRAIMLSAHIRDHFIDAATEAGAWGYFSKSAEPDEIVEAIRRVRAGEFVLDSQVARRVRRGTGGETNASRLHLLTPRELQVLRLIGEGKTRAAIAAEMHRSPKTIDTHRMSIMEKLDIHDRGELVRFAIREGLSV